MDGVKVNTITGIQSALFRDIGSHHRTKL